MRQLELCKNEKVTDLKKRMEQNTKVVKDGSH